MESVIGTSMIARVLLKRTKVLLEAGSHLCQIGMTPAKTTVDRRSLEQATPTMFRPRLHSSRSIAESGEEVSLANHLETYL